MRISDWSSDVCSSDLSFDIGTGPLEPDPYIMETGKVDLGVYYTKDRFEAEKEIFGRVWLNVAEAAEIPNPGDWVVRDVAVRSASVVIVRGKDNPVRPFDDICPHTGMKLVVDEKGRGGRFAGLFHARVSNSGGEVMNHTEPD